MRPSEQRPARPRFRRSIAARITGLVIVLLLAAGTSAVVTLGQLRAMQAKFDRLTEVYVVFNQRLAEAHVQAVRVHEQIRSHQKAAESLAPERPDPAFLDNFEMALEARNRRIALAREPIDDALTSPAPYGGELHLEELLGLQRSLDDLQGLVTLEELVDPSQVLSDVQTQNQITQLFKSLSQQSAQAIVDLREEVRAAQVQTERLTVGLTLATTLLGILAAIGVFLTLRPLRKLALSVRELGQGDWTQRVDIPGTRQGDEVSQLAAEFNLMAAALEERERRLLRGERLAAAGQLAAQITHEIRNPLSSVALNVELLADELDEARSEGRHLLHEIEKEVDRLTEITEGYLSFARRPSPELVPMDLKDELRSLVDFMRLEFEQAGLSVRVHLPPRGARILGDARQLRQAFMNLLRNAQEAALDEDAADDERTPWIAVRMRDEGEEVVVEVADNGPGIPEELEVRDRIFEAFFTRKAKGTGLGLPSVQQIVGDHGGQVRVAHSSPDGTTFEVRIPAYLEGTAVAPPRAVVLQ